MTMPGYIRTPDGKLVAMPTPVPAPERVEEEEAVAPRDDGFSDILDVTEEDVMGTEGVALPEEEENEDLFSVPEEEDEEEGINSLFGVSEADAMEYPPKPQKPKFRRVVKPYPPPPTTLGGMR